MANDISQTILKFYTQINNDANHRFVSWEHCYYFFGEADWKNAHDIDKACLHLAFYLASWGMYRGSGFLLSKDYLIHKEVTQYLLAHRQLRNFNFNNATPSELAKDADAVVEIIDWIKGWYKNHIAVINGEPAKVTVSDTLATKIALGTLGCVPAYDRFFVDGMRFFGKQNGDAKLLGFSSPIKPKHIMGLFKFYCDNQAQFNGVHQTIASSCKVNYPPMKLLDMYFWQIGYKQSL